MPVRKALSLIALLLAAAPAHAEFADTVVVNAKIVTLDPARPNARALASRGERITGVFDHAPPASAVGAATRVIDAHGRTLVPGLIDSHIHAIRAGLTFNAETSFDGARTIADAMARLRAAAAQSGAHDWIVVGGGWTPQQFAEGRRPTRAEIEAAAPGRRVYLQLFYRAIYLSEAAQKAVGRSADDPPDGLSPERDPDGSPAGWFSGGVEAVTAVWDQLPKPGIEAAKAGVRAFFSTLNAYGVTGVIDPGGHNLAPADYEPVFALAREKGLTMRVDYFLSAPARGRELEDLRALVARAPSDGPGGYLRFAGVGERVTFGLYNNDRPSLEDIDGFEAVARWALERGVGLTVHWNNARSAQPLFDAFARVGDARERARLRWSVAHLHDATPETLATLRQLGLGWLTQNALYFAAPAFLRSLPAARRASAPPVASALRAGLKVAAGTDATRVMSWNPFVALQWLLDGRTVDGLETRDVDERPTREEALRLWTQGGAWFAFAEEDRGRIAPGLLADLAIIDADYMSVPTEQIGAIQSVLTMVGGRVVHDRERAAP